jgi:hypothetical protein
LTTAVSGGADHQQLNTDISVQNAVMLAGTSVSLRADLLNAFDNPRLSVDGGVPLSNPNCVNGAMIRAHGGRAAT